MKALDAFQPNITSILNAFFAILFFPKQRAITTKHTEHTEKKKSMRRAG
jgi:hypothetical protein